MAGKQKSRAASETQQPKGWMPAAGLPSKWHTDYRGPLPPDPISPEVRAEVFAKAKQERLILEREAARNKFPVLTLVRADAFGWRNCDARVVRDDGPTDDGSRKIEIEKVSGPRAGERATVRRDRVRASPAQ